MADVRAMAIGVLRVASEPLSADQILSRIVEQLEPGAAPPRKSTVTGALSYNPLCERVQRDRYVYLPRSFGGASFRLPLLGADPQQRRLPIGFEVGAALRPVWTLGEDSIKVTLLLAGGPALQVRIATLPSLGSWLALPAAFWSWLEGQRERGVDWLVLRCLDAEAARFSLEGLQSARLDPSAVAARNAQLAATAREVVGRARTSLSVTDLVNRLVVRGVYHAEPQPDPLAWVLFEQDGRFHADFSSITFREVLTPGLRRLLADRLLHDEFAVEFLRGTTSAAMGEQEGAAERVEVTAEAPVPPAQQLYRFKVALQWRRRVWRVIEILDNQTLEDLHLAIQDAFGWDNDHLYAFFLSGQAWDGLTEFESPFGDAEPPTVDEVLLQELELQPKQKFLYLFDFGDELRHDVELLEVLPAPGEGRFPRIVQVHGEAPPQYSDEED